MKYNKKQLKTVLDKYPKDLIAGYLLGSLTVEESQQMKAFTDADAEFSEILTIIDIDFSNAAYEHQLLQNIGQLPPAPPASLPKSFLDKALVFAKPAAAALAISIGVYVWYNHDRPNRSLAPSTETALSTEALQTNLGNLFIVRGGEHCQSDEPSEKGFCAILSKDYVNAYKSFKQSNTVNADTPDSTLLYYEAVTELLAYDKQSTNEDALRILNSLTYNESLATDLFKAIAYLRNNEPLKAKPLLEQTLKNQQHSSYHTLTKSILSTIE